MKQAALFPIHAEDRMLDVLPMTAEERGGYFMLLLLLWRLGPMNGEKAAALLGEKQGLSDRLATAFFRAEDGTLSAPWMEAHRDLLKAQSERNSRNGSKGGRPEKKRRSKKKSERLATANQPVSDRFPVADPAPESDRLAPGFQGPEQSNSASIQRERVKSDSVKESGTPRARKSRVVRVLFDEGPVADFDTFRFQFEALGLGAVDLRHYFNAAQTWSRSNGERKVDWVETVKGWMLRDKAAGKLMMARTAEEIGQTTQDALDYLNMGQAQPKQ